MIIIKQLLRGLRVPTYLEEFKEIIKNTKTLPIESTRRIAWEMEFMDKIKDAPTIDDLNELKSVLKTEDCKSISNTIMARYLDKPERWVSAALESAEKKLGASNHGTPKKRYE